jgi:hypothetical protein
MHFIKLIGRARVAWRQSSHRPELEASFGCHREPPKEAWRSDPKGRHEASERSRGDLLELYEIPRFARDGPKGPDCFDPKGRSQ